MISADAGPGANLPIAALLAEQLLETPLDDRAASLLAAFEVAADAFDDLPQTIEIGFYPAKLESPQFGADVEVFVDRFLDLAAQLVAFRIRLRLPAFAKLVVVSNEFHRMPLQLLIAALEFARFVCEELGNWVVLQLQVDPFLTGGRPGRTWTAETLTGQRRSRFAALESFLETDAESIGTQPLEFLGRLIPDPHETPGKIGVVLRDQRQDALHHLEMSRLTSAARSGTAATHSNTTPTTMFTHSRSSGTALARRRLAQAAGTFTFSGRRGWILGLIGRFNQWLVVFLSGCRSILSNCHFHRAQRRAHKQDKAQDPDIQFFHGFTSHAGGGTVWRSQAVRVERQPRPSFA